MKIELDASQDYKDLSSQLEKIREEKKEVEEEVMKLKYCAQKEGREEQLASELFDLMQASFTLLINIIPESKILDLNLKHLKKLESRKKTYSHALH